MASDKQMTPICYELALPTGTAMSYDLQRAKNSIGAAISGDIAQDPYSDEETEIVEWIAHIWGDRPDEWAAFLTACVNSYHDDQGRTLENIPQGLVWRLVDALELTTARLMARQIIDADKGRAQDYAVYAETKDAAQNAYTLLDSLNIKEAEE